MEDMFEIGIWLMPFVVPIVVFLLLAIQEAQGAAGVEKALIRHSKGCRANINVVEKDQPIHIKALHSAAHASSISRLCFRSSPPLSQKPSTTFPARESHPEEVFDGVEVYEVCNLLKY